ncbi:RRM domain-containing protein [Heracleum sosnowskyi]|uniref:RRM domain-containing protein n=1 Tax=Heracleum sosnowskyi TaxID=360622 RepID=A0AAD8HI03_9APIA|nr:RRM domain-containing protein [Heracleum sosnowskyi]
MDEELEQFKVFVGGVSWMTTEESLRDHFEKFGPVARVAIARDRYTGTPRGFAFVSFTEQSAFESALLVEHHHILGRTVDVKRAIPRSEQCQIELQQSRGLSRNSRSNIDGGKQAEVKRAVPKEVTNNGYSGQGGSGRIRNGLQPYGFSPRHDLFHGQGHLPQYGAHPGYGGFFGYPYGVYGVGFPAGYPGFGYGMAPFVPTSSWNGPGMPGVRGYPYAGAANIYPPYPNGGVGGRGLAVNRLDDAQVAVDRKSPSSDGGNGLLAN